MADAPSVRIHTVLFHNDPDHLHRALSALAHAAVVARREGVAGRITLAYGDCSASPIFAEPAWERVRSQGGEGGLDEVSYTFFDANLGHGGGVNSLLQDLDADYALVVNPDTVVSPRLLVELLAGFASDGSVGAVEARQLPFEHPKEYDPVTGETPWVAGACLMLPASVIREVGGIDHESFFLYGDDVDWSWRIRLAGYRLIFRETAIVFHDKRVDQAGGWPIGSAEEYFSAEASLIMAYKWGRPDLVERYTAMIERAGSALDRKALADFRTQEHEGKLPHPVDGASTVATFIEDRYAHHRF